MHRFNLSAWAVAHPTLILFLILMIGVAGTLSYRNLGRAEDPSYTIKVAVVTAAWPGATAEEMQFQVADRIEKKLQELPSFYKVTTYSKPGFVAAQMEFRDTTPPGQVPWLFYLVRKKMVDLKPDLPDGVIGPNVNDEYGDVDSIVYMLRSESADYATLKRVAEAARQRLLKVNNVSKVTIYGTQDERIFVDFDHVKLANLGIAPQAIFDSLARQNALSLAGMMQTASTRIPLRVTGAFDGVKAVEETPVAANGAVIRLGDIATVSRGFIDPPEFLARHRGVPALALGIVMQKGANILKLGGDVEAVMTEVDRATPVGLVFERMANQPAVVAEAVDDFMRSFVEALAIVLIVSFLSLGWRTGIVVAASVPLVLGVVFSIMLMIGIDLHRISLGALIIALGLLVDDAIIAVEMMVVKMEQGVGRAEAAAFAWQSTAFPMLTGTLVTAAGFVPVGFAASGTAEYAGSIFWVVAIALIASWVVAVIFTPYLGFKLLPTLKTTHAGDPGAIYQTGIYRRLRSVVSWCVQHRIKVVVATFAMFALSVIGFGKVSKQFFPASDRPELFVQLRLPEGSAIGATIEAAKRAEALLAGDDDAATWASFIGKGPPRFLLNFNPALPNEAYAEIVVVARSGEARERIKAKIEHAVADGAIPDARVRVNRLRYGPPIEFPVQFRVIGADPNTVRGIAYQVRDILRANPNAIEPQLDWNEQMPSIRLVVDQDRARALGLDPQTVAQTLQTLVTGSTVTTVRDRTEKVAVVARAVASQRGDIGAIGDLTVLSRNGVPVPLSQVARIEQGHEEAIQWRRNRDMVITVRTDVRDGVQAPDVSAAVWATLGDLRQRLPEGYRIELGGAIEDSGRANGALVAVMPMMLVIMLTVLMVQLQSFSRLALVLLTAPLGLIGACLGLLVSGKPFGFVALLGLIALAGMIIRNAVILVDQIEHDVAAGHPRRVAIIDATVRRARPVVLTSLAAVLAMIPLSRSSFWGPMAVAIMGGLLVATALTLLFLPALYALWFRRSLDGTETVSGWENLKSTFRSLTTSLPTISRGRRSADHQPDNR
ncbi:efflux RND transporter permease subunit [Rhodopseudomonas pseudopalustris]|uniref:Multidrug efflux pump subunit AcrB n=1 Tax=Rhodopseudomonas pseudopalustris TaxID=1513892 RepID=A0A1H8UK89_9BRAD|nr:efflux RND transporter permease subunit [Rhodopseudomonas pseudopalustris]SEP03629.1 Multidrug efflux pump subunit AcrB [Rhodopseudomonas pseudopalustris]